MASMSNNPTKLSSNIASVLFSNNTPFSIRLYRNKQHKNPFEKIKLPMGSHFYLAELALGSSFYKKKILLRIYQQDDQSQTNLVDVLSKYDQIENNPFPSILTFDSDTLGTKQFFPPLFYCSNKNVFFHAFCDICQSILIYNDNAATIECKYCMKLSANKTQFHMENTEDMQSLETLILSFGNLQGPESEMPCITCDNHMKCFNVADDENVKPNVLKFIHPIATKNFSLYAFEYTPLMLSEFSNLVGGMNKSNFNSELEKQGDGNRSFIMEDSIKHLSDSAECNIFTALIKKLRIFLGLCDIALTFEAEDISPDPYMKMENIRVKLQESFTRIDQNNVYPCLLPILNTSKEKIFKEKLTSLHIQTIISAKNNRNTVVEVVMFDEDGNPAPIALGDVIELYFEEVQIPFIVKQKNHQNIVLETLKVLDSTLEHKYLAYFSQEPSQLVKYILLDDVNSQGNYANLGHLFFILLLSNSVLGEAEVNHGLKILFSKIRQLDSADVNETSLNTIIHTTPALSVVFRQENTLYKPEINNSQLISDLYWLQLLTIGIKLSGINVINPKNSLADVRDEIELLLSAINKDPLIERVDKVDDSELIKSALSGIIDDANWIESALTAKRTHTIIKDNETCEVDKTNIYTKNNNDSTTDNATKIMPNKRPL